MKPSIDNRGDAVVMATVTALDTTLSMMLLFTWLSRMHRENVGSLANVFKSLRFGPFTLKRNPGVFKLKRDLHHFQKVVFRGQKRRSRVNKRPYRSKSDVF